MHTLQVRIKKTSGGIFFLLQIRNIFVLSAVATHTERMIDSVTMMDSAAVLTMVNVIAK